MNVFHKFVRKSLAKNRTRTIVTIIGIILSMALFTAVIEGAYSGIMFMINCEVETHGPWHGYYTNLSETGVKENLSSRPEIDQASEFSLVGWADIGSSNKYKPYLVVKSAGDGLENLINIRLLSGRMPENSSEILLPNHLASNGKVIYEVGDTLTISVGERTLDGMPISEAVPFNTELDEEIIDQTEVTYTVVGTYERLDYTVEEYSCPGYTAITRNADTESETVFFTVKNPRKFYDFISSVGIVGDLYEHSDLLNLYGTVNNANLTTVIYGFAGILCALIAFGSISLIYNAFSISVSERTKQFGILKSVGATKKQIRASVFYEALFLDLLAVPIGLLLGCGGIGLTLYLLKDAFSSMTPEGVTTTIHIVIAPIPLAVAALICVITTFISAWVPANRAMRIPVMEAIRQTNDVNVRGKDVRTSRLTAKLFGFEGMMAAKNFKRNRKRYRATIVSLFLSIVLFISASSFCAYLNDSVDGVMTPGIEADICYEIFFNEEDVPSKDVHNLLLSAEGVTSGFYANETSLTVMAAPEIYDKSYLNYMPEDSVQEVGKFCMLCFVNDDNFRDICKDNNINAEDYFDSTSPKALLQNHSVVGRAEGANDQLKWYEFNFVDPLKIPCTLYSNGIKEISGYVNLFCEETDGKREYIYYSIDYMEAYWSTHDDESEMDLSEALILSEEEATIVKDYEIAGVINKIPYALPNNRILIVYPLSMQQYILDEPMSTMFVYKASNHQKAYDDMKKMLDDHHLDSSTLIDTAKTNESNRMFVTIINIFSYGFIILIALISVANVFNTISTSITLRRREIAMLKSIGMSKKSLKKMMSFECLTYGLKSIVWGLPVSVLVTYAIYRVTDVAFSMSFYIPWQSIVIAAGSVFIVVFSTMIYATSKVNKDNPIDALKNESI